MQKNYKRRDGRVMLTDANISKMNVLECMYYHRHMTWDKLVDLCEDVPDAFYTFVNLLTIPIVPFVYPVLAYIRIRDAKEEMYMLAIETPWGTGDDKL